MKLADSVKTNLVPNAGDTIEVIEHITSMIKANISHSRHAASRRELLCFELVVQLPLASESLQLSTLRNTNSRSNRKLFLIRLHRERTPSVGTLISTTAILEAEMISQIDVGDDFDDPRILSIDA